MNPTNFPEKNLTFAENQPPYRPLPAHFDEDSGRVTSAWSLSWRERLRVLFTGVVWVQVLTFNNPLQPQKLSAEKPWFLKHE